MARLPDQTDLTNVVDADPRFGAAIVFGSVARGTHRPDSDLDLAVLYADHESRESVERQLLEVLGRLALATGRDVHLVDLERIDAGFRRTILDRGRVLLDRTGRRLRDLRVATGIEYLDWAYARRVADARLGRRRRPAVVDLDVLRGKTERVLHHLARLQARSPVVPSALEKDEDLLSLVTMDVQQAVQACIDLAVHACADENLGIPTGPADAFSRLARARYLDEALAVRLAGAAGLRNLIVHRYGELDCTRLVDIVRDELSDLEAFVEAMRRAG